MTALLLAFQIVLASQPLMLVSEYGTGNLRGFDPETGAEIMLPEDYQPIGGVPGGADGMVMDVLGRIHVTREDGTIFRSDVEGQSFALFATMPGAGQGFFLLDLTRNESHLYTTRFGATELYQVALADAEVTVIPGPSTANRLDGVRRGPDERIY